ncbi:MAG: iron-containing alcohol dehydrogenase [Nitrososphaerota archaeon]
MNLNLPGLRLGEEFDCECGKKHELYIKKVVLGEDVVYNILEVIEELNLSGSVLVVDDEITRKIAGINLIGLLKQNNIPVTECTIFKPTISEVSRVAQMMSNIDFSIAVGGGSVIDTCKLASYKRNIPFISVPTTLSHDGVVSATASIINEMGKKETYLCRSPIAVIFDLNILRSQPRRMIAAGCGDMLAKATSLKDWELARDEKNEYYCPTAARLSLMTYDEVTKFINMGGIDIAAFSMSIFKSGLAMAMIGSSRPNSGSEHLISHYIDINSRNPAMHGEQVGLATILMSMYHSEYNKNWWVDEKYQWYYIKSMLEKINAPVTVERLGVELGVLIDALVEGYKLRPSRYTILHKRPISRQEALSLLKSTGTYTG